MGEKRRTRNSLQTNGNVPEADLLMSSPPPFLAQIARFAMVGIAATASHYIVLIALVELANVGPVLATTIGYAIGTSVSYVLNRRFTFKSDAPVASSFLKFATLYAIGAVLNGAILGYLVAQGVWYVAAQVIATGVTLVWNFIGARFVVFR